MKLSATKVAIERVGHCGEVAVVGRFKQGSTYETVCHKSGH